MNSTCTTYKIHSKSTFMFFSAYSICLFSIQSYFIWNKYNIRTFLERNFKNDEFHKTKKTINFLPYNAIACSDLLLIVKNIIQNFVDHRKIKNYYLDWLILVAPTLKIKNFAGCS